MKEYIINFPFYHKIEIPKYYDKIEEKIDGISFKYSGLFIIISIEEKNNKRWVHVSYSRKSRVPNYEDTLRIKEHFIGEDKKAIMIFPERKYYVNIMPYCLHLFSCLDTWDIPEFSKGGMI